MTGETLSPIKVALIDDHAMIREALSSVLTDDPGVQIVAQGGSRSDALRIAGREEPDVMILDFNLPDGSALDVLEEFERQESPIKVLILTMHESADHAVRTLEAGAQGFLVKSSAVEELLDAIHFVDVGKIWITPALSSAVLDELRRPKERRTGLASLSSREFDLLRLLGTGIGIKEAAGRLDVTVSTASTYRARLMKKLDLSSVHELIRYALEHDLVQ